MSSIHRLSPTARNTSARTANSGLKADLRIAERLGVGPVALRPQRDHDPGSHGRATNERPTMTEVPDGDDGQAGTAHEEHPTQGRDRTRDFLSHLMLASPRAA